MSRPTRAPAAASGDVASLAGLGPASRAMLERAGIPDVATLRRLGTVPAYVRVKRADPRASLNLLWALEGALSGLPWQEVARRHRASLLLALETAMAQVRATGPSSGN